MITAITCCLQNSLVWDSTTQRFLPRTLKNKGDENLSSNLSHGNSITTESKKIPFGPIVHTCCGHRGENGVFPFKRLQEI
jgi:hypothetical protein